MTRRVLLSSALAVVTTPVATAAQQARDAKVVGFLGNADPNSMAPSIRAFSDGLRELGWIEGKTIRTEFRWADGRVDLFPQLAAELVQLKVDALLVAGPPGLRAARDATNTIPIIVAVYLLDPVAAGFVKSLARPGGNITGLVSQYEDIVTKQVQLFRDVLPNLSRLVVLRHSSSDPAASNAATSAAATLGLKARLVEVIVPADLDQAFKTAREVQAHAIHVLASPIFAAHRRQLVDLAARYRFPAMYEHDLYVRDGGLLSYGPNIPEMYRRAATYVDRILKGANAGDLPMERPAKFELAVNLKTAKALALTIPPALLLRADQVIE